MTQRGRKSAAGELIRLVQPLAQPIELVPRPRPPADITTEESEIWTAVVNRLPADWFPAETLPMLAQYCRHTIQARRVGQLIEQAVAGSELAVDDYDKLLRMQERESRAIATLATRMRFSQHSLTNHRGNGKITGAKKPWQS